MSLWLGNPKSHSGMARGRRRDTVARPSLTGWGQQYYRAYLPHTFCLRPPLAQPGPLGQQEALEGNEGVGGGGSSRFQS